MRWPVRSPDLTPCDFYLWGFIKSKAYARALDRPIRDATELKERIISAFNDETPDLRRSALRECCDPYRRELSKMKDVTLEYICMHISRSVFSMKHDSI